VNAFGYGLSAILQLTDFQTIRIIPMFLEIWAHMSKLPAIQSQSNPVSLFNLEYVCWSYLQDSYAMELIKLM